MFDILPLYRIPSEIVGVIKTLWLILLLVFSKEIR